ncbi:Bifunctional hemolysin/adenylate cyclase precursor [compost metagenome]
MATVNGVTVTGSTINGTNYYDTINGANITEVIYGLGGSDTIHGNDGNDTLYGGTGSDTLYGDNGNDILNAGTEGSKTLTGGAGNDTFVINRGISYSFDQEITDFDVFADRLDLRLVGVSDLDTLNRLLEVNSSGETFFTIQTNYAYSRTTLNGLWSSGFDQFSASNVLLSATLADDTLTATSKSDLFGGLGNDRLTGSSYDDRLFGESGNDTLNGMGGEDLLVGAAGNDTLNGGDGYDTLEGGAGNDRLDGGLRNNTLSGGAGSDIFVVQRGASYAGEDLVTDFAIDEQDKLDVSGLRMNDLASLKRLIVDNGLGDTIRNYKDGSYADITLSGVAIADLTTASVILNTAATNDVLTAAGRSDLFGGLGNDTLTGSSYSDRLFGEGGADILKGGNGDDLLVGGIGSDNLSGGNDNDVLEGGADNDRLDGGLGSNTLNGGAGSDVFVVQRGGAYVHQDLIADFRTAELDKLDVSQLGIGDIESLKRLILNNGSGDTLRNYRDGYDADITLSGVAITGLTTANLILNKATTNDVLVASSQSDLFGGLGNDTLTGSAYGDRLFGEAGTDILEGVNGNDLLVGGAGNDTLNGGDGYDSLEGGIGDDTLSGDAGNDSLLGGSGNDVLIGGAGSDRIDGGIGIDTLSFVGELSAVTVNLGLMVSQRTIADRYENDQILNVENVVGGNANDRIVGNASNNQLDGNVGDDVLSGGLGNDTLRGAAGNDTLNGGDGVDTASYEGAGAVTVNLGLTTAQNTLGAGLDRLLYIENLSGSNYNDKLTGNAAANALNGGAGADTLIGGLGNDTLIGGTGKDTLTGGDGNDVFDFNALLEMGTTSATWDVITDFARGSDKIDLSTLDANTATTANDAFTSIIGSATAFSAAGQLKVSGGVLYGNTDADSTAEFAIQLTGVTALSAADFYL